MIVLIFFILFILTNINAIYWRDVSLDVNDHIDFGLDDDLTCNSCQDVIAQWGDIARNATKLAEITDNLQSICKMIKGLSDEQEALCEKVAAGVVKILPFIEKQTEFLAWDSPEALCALVNKCTINCCETDDKPEQIRLSLTDQVFTEMAVTWSTLNGDDFGTVEWGTCKKVECLTNSSKSLHKRTYNWAGWNGQIYTAIMTSLEPDTTYHYRVKSSNNTWSDIYHFTTLHKDAGLENGKPLKIGVVADIAYDENSDHTVKSLKYITENKHIDLLLVVGDMSYADGYQKHWDMYLRKIEPVTRYIPMMVCPGNHEFWFGFASYRSRFYMPMYDATENMFYNFDINGIHFLGVSTENSIDVANIGPVEQYFMNNDLQNAKSATWKIAFMHRPLYCGGTKSDCTKWASHLRNQVEDIYYNNQVDLVLSGHVHNYQRMYPTYQEKVMSESYESPLAPVYILNGAAGNREGLSSIVEDHPYQAAASDKHGYGVIKIQGKVATYTQHASSSRDEIDTVTITK